MTSSPLAHKLDAFLRKYYLNALLRGLLLNTALLVSSLLIIVLLEYWGWFGSTVRALLFWGYLGAFIVATFWWVARPLSWLFRLRQPLKYEEAALIVGNHFSAVRDKLLNALQLEQQQKQHPESVLLQAAIDQKRKELSVFDFRQAVNLGLNRKYLPYALPPLLALAFILFAAPAIVLDPVYRIAHYKEPFSPPPPFRFVVSDPLETTENQNYLLRVVTEGLVVPEEMSIEIEGASYSMLREAAGRFSFEFRAPRTDIHFRLRCGKYYSEPMVLKVRKKAALLHLRIMARYPAYTGLNAQTFEQGDITVPEGTLLEFQMHVKNTHSVKFLTDSLKPLPSLEPEDGRVALTYRARNSLSYRIALSGTEGSGDTLRFNLTVIPDRFPEITVEERGDSLMSTLRAFRGDLRDDYGLRSLTFSYEIRGTDGRSGGRQKVSLPLPSGARQHLFVHTMDFGLLQPAPGDQIHYSFIVCDNDGVHGSKCTSTPERILRIPTLEEQQERTRQTDQSVADNISGSLQQSQRMDKELQSLQRQLTEKRGSDWQDRKKAEDLLRMEESLRRQIEQLKKDMETAQRLREQWPNDPTLEERKALEKETDKLLTDELRHLLEEIRKLLEQQGDRSQLKEMVEQARETTLSLEKQLERLRELFKKLELESLLNAAADKLDQMAREQRREAEENRQAGADQVSQAQQDQYKINQDFQDLKQQLKEIEQKNQALENPMDHLSELQEQAADIQQELDRASEKLEQNTPRKASEHQKNAASK
ncbi:MAG: hypothetical protein NZM65_03685, partial [Flavobacteriales bacterium]|nr:hypothetical protein [Flavobacteriales bacterium]MDW8409770.1 DUF4175 family protein [Flavobacteriales bacterium]